MTPFAPRLAGAAEACRLKLEEDGFAAVLSQLGPLGRPEKAFELLSGLGHISESSERLRQLCAVIPSPEGENLVERTLLVLASQHAIRLVPSLAVSDSVKRLFADEFQFFANPPSAWVVRLQTDHVRYHEMARVATLRRFPAGQCHWEVAGFPRSWVAEARHPWKVLAWVAFWMRGFKPVFELHLNDRRECPLMLLEEEMNISIYRAARSMEKQPAVRGLMGESWLYCESTARVTPHLAWLRQIVQAGGASLFELGPAALDSGFMKGSGERRRSYEQGAYRPTITCFLWPRKALIDWAGQHPEFDL